jgi:hypothetical protein
MYVLATVEQIMLRARAKVGTAIASSRSAVVDVEKYDPKASNELTGRYSAAAVTCTGAGLGAPTMRSRNFMSELSRSYTSTQ